MEKLTIRSYAKINPFLAIGEKREGGYHEVRTLLRLISLHDKISIYEHNEFELVCSDPSLSGERNLCWKATRLLSEAVEIPPLRIRIEKEIPTEAGLGGGSSNAGFMLRALNHLTGNLVSNSDLLAIAAACGADVPFFASGLASAWGTGFGEKLEYAGEMEEEWLVIAKPSVGCPSAAAYAALDLVERPIRLEGEPYRNEFDQVAPAESRKLINEISALGAKGAILSGSGSAVVGFAESEIAARQMERELRSLAAFSTVSKTMSTQEVANAWMS